VLCSITSTNKGGNKMKNHFKIITILLLIVLIGLSGCTEKTTNEATNETSENDAEKITLTIFHAGSLSMPFDEAEQAFEAAHPDVDILREPKGSRATMRKVTDLGRIADVIAVADYAGIETLMFPEYADWYAAFARNKMVIIFNNNSIYADEITTDNWQEILTRDGVEVAHSEPNDDPCGYRAVIVYNLSSQFYNDPSIEEKLIENTPPTNIRSTETDLLALLDAGELDYVFIYRSIAVQHEYRFVELPPELSLSEIEHKDFYYNGTCPLSDGTVKHGAPIVYGITIPINAEHPEIAQEFVEFILGSSGQQIMEKNGQPSIVPAKTNDIDLVPDNIKPLVEELN
jgi:molybdate/tungstate transport system substrate-binding protein